MEIVRRSLLFLAALPLLAVDANFPDPALDVKKASPAKQTAVFAGGCFWCVEAVFEIMEGVEDVVSGYSGDTEEKAKYDIVSGGATKHAEAVLITFDPTKTSYGQLLKIFFSVAHDPTSLNRQGPDVGTQYRSAIFYANAEQKKVAEAYIQQLNKAHVFPKMIVTEVAALDKFYTAESYHQNYAGNNRWNPYIVNVSDPKVEKLKKLFPGCLRKSKTPAKK
ncbi:MAG: peptide-methionine (S)-S-oxide reductase MsrA [Bryobacteraceae bacterium]|nr:peptide-methionine (S)-S-oxide reductase MsrA [Bryobacteraceae bacterium]